jgi:predicted acyltransferase
MTQARSAAAAPLQPVRDESLDALRGLSVLGMVLSGSIAFGAVLPGWMFHAQVPPPLHRFTPSMPGITWVDLVFPFFLFAMGAALPLALAHKTSWRQWLPVAARRFVLLLVLALAYQHFKAVSLAAPGTATAWTHATSLLGFALLGALLGPGPLWLKAVSAAGLAALMSSLPFADGRGFVLTRSDIILVVLANMAAAGTAFYAFMRAGARARLWPWVLFAPLPVLAAVLLAPSAGAALSSWTQQVLQATPAPWAYKFFYLKYLFLLVPGMVAGEILRAEPRPGTSATAVPLSAVFAILALVGCNLWGLYTRELLINLLLNAALSGALVWRLRASSAGLRAVAHLGVYLLWLGLVCEPLEGGIKKDSSTFSYYFVTGGLAALFLLALRGLAMHPSPARMVGFFAAQGRNPLLAYVAGALLVAPLLHLLGLHAAWAGLNTGPWVGLLRGVLFTAAVALVVVWANRRGWVWKA